MIKRVQEDEIMTEWAIHQDDKASTGKREDQPRPDDKEVAKPAARTCLIRAQRLSRRAFF